MEEYLGHAKGVKGIQMKTKFPLQVKQQTKPHQALDQG